MVENIKSQYFQKILLSSLNEKTKLDLIKYNKHFQNLMDIKLINYKFYKGKYIVYETKGKGKEYFNGELSFEGEYLNGKRNGKGKEYYENGNIKFEGEYLNGKRNGKGKKYYENGNIKFEGEYLNGENWNGKLYDPENINIYEIKMDKDRLKNFLVMVI